MTPNRGEGPSKYMFAVCLIMCVRLCAHVCVCATLACGDLLLGISWGGFGNHGHSVVEIAEGSSRCRGR